MNKIEKITMKAAVLTKLNAPLKILNVELPETLDVGQVLVKINYSGICGSQIGEINGIKGKDRFLPHLLGHEGSGQVIQIGKGVRTVKPNDNVVLHWRKGKGKNSKTPIYKANGKIINAGYVTTFNEYAIVSENRVTTIDNSVDLSIAPLLGCAVTTGFGVVENNSKVKMGESIVIYGAGGIGLSMVQAASIIKAYPIIAVDIFDNRLRLAKKLGATHIINVSKNSKTELIIKKILQNNCLDIFIDNTGDSKVIEQGYNLVSKIGRLVLVGVPKKKDKVSIHTLPIHFGKKIIGSEGGKSKPQLDIPKFVKMYKDKKLDLESMVTKIYSLNKINNAIYDMKSGKLSGKCIIKI